MSNEPNQRERVKRLAGEAARLAPDERAAFLEQRCAGDEETLRLALAMLEQGGLSGASTDTHRLDDDPTHMNRSVEDGETIGAYKLVEKIGEGGMGVVYRAEQPGPMRREVALKVIKLGMDTKEVVARFETERQALAVMDHPNIARVLDAGATDRGRPFFVMELVRGIPLSTYCDKNKLTIPQRLDLFIAVCRAVQHAHQKGVIHRDLKPTNVLVALHGGNPVPKIIDFGVAKATGLRLTQKTMFTTLGQVVGTPEYMSPEQAELSSLDIDTRTDIYSLGVILYEMITGCLPFESAQLRSSLSEMQRIIREVEPPRPSTRITTLDGQRKTEITTRRATEPSALRRHLRGDLDWIVMKSLEKDRTRRYETANGLALDVQRYLNNEIVTARSPSTAYRLAKFYRRNRLGVTLAALLVLAVVCGAVGTGIGFFRAKDETKKARAAVSLMEEMWLIIDPETGRPTDVRISEALDHGAAKLGGDNLDPEVEAPIRTAIGKMDHRLDREDQAVSNLERASELYESSYGLADERTLATLNALYQVYWHVNRLPESEEGFRELLGHYERLLGRRAADTLTCKQNLASTSLRRKKFGEAESLFESVLEERRDLLGSKHKDTTATMNNLSQLYAQTDRPEQAIALLTEALEIRRGTLGNDHTRTLSAACNLGKLYAKVNRLEDAESLLRESVVGFRQLYSEKHRYFLEALGTFAEVLRQLGRLDEAESHALDNFRLQSAKYGPASKRSADAADLLVRLYEASGDAVQAARWRERLEESSNP